MTGRKVLSKAGGLSCPAGVMAAGSWRPGRRPTIRGTPTGRPGDRRHQESADLVDQELAPVQGPWRSGAKSIKVDPALPIRLLRTVGVTFTADRLTLDPDVRRYQDQPPLPPDPKRRGWWTGFSIRRSLTIACSAVVASPLGTVLISNSSASKFLGAGFISSYTTTDTTDLGLPRLRPFFFFTVTLIGSYLAGHNDVQDTARCLPRPRVAPRCWGRPSPFPGTWTLPAHHSYRAPQSDGSPQPEGNRG